jgi:O-antigen/teichoic acid export membrane protein
LPKRIELSIKKLAGQTIWYGASSIAARFLYYLLTPYLTHHWHPAEFGEMSTLYAAIPFLNVIFTYGMETTYFRFVQRGDSPAATVYSTGMISIISSTILLTGILLWWQNGLVDLLKLQAHPEFITYTVFIICVDTLATLPLAKLRQNNRPRKFALIQILTIILNIALVYFFITTLPNLIAANPDSIFKAIYIPEYGVGYLIIANLIASAFTLLLLYKEFFSFKLRFDPKLWRTMLVYALPLILVGFAGMINETFDRIMLLWWGTGDLEHVKTQVGIYSACYKLSLLISLFIQAFRMGAEPFFFQQAGEENPQRVYARVMKFFVITITVMFLVVALYLDIWKHFISRPPSADPHAENPYWEGLKVVPILLLANMFLGIYYNLAIWYKLTHKTLAGAYITLIGAAITLFINYYFIPRFSYMACAWATFACYGSMMVFSFVWGQKAYRIPYAWKKLVSYMVIVVLFYFLHTALIHEWTGRIFNLSLATFLLLIYISFVARVERRELERLPVVGRFFRR